jgi:membrane dipeptidase
MLADASGDDGDRGIGTELTKSVFRINEMNCIGMIVDLPHVSKNVVVIDVLGGSPEKGWNGSLAPLIFSHSFAYALCPHPRNVTDEVLRLVKEHGALVMITFVPDFVSCKAGNNKNGLPDPVPEGATMEKVVEHIRHVGQLIGYDYVSISANSAGIPSTAEELDDASEGCRKEFAPGVEGG